MTCDAPCGLPNSVWRAPEEPDHEQDGADREQHGADETPCEGLRLTGDRLEGLLFGVGDDQAEQVLDLVPGPAVAAAARAR